MRIACFAAQPSGTKCRAYNGGGALKKWTAISGPRIPRWVFLCLLARSQEAPGRSQAGRMASRTEPVKRLNKNCLPTCSHLDLHGYIVNAGKTKIRKSFWSAWVWLAASSHNATDALQQKVAFSLGKIEPPGELSPGGAQLEACSDPDGTRAPTKSAVLRRRNATFCWWRSSDRLTLAGLSNPRPKKVQLHFEKVPFRVGETLCFLKK